MPGAVVGVSVAPGDEVSAGQKLLTLEAMKMQTILTAERDAKIAEVHAAAGKQVETGDLLVVLAERLAMPWHVSVRRPTTT